MQFTVAVVSADRIARERLARELRTGGFRVIARETATSTALSLEEPDLVLLDLAPSMLAGLGDLRVMSLALGVPVIAHLALPSESAQLMCFSAGARDVVLRGISTAVLLARVRAALPVAVETAARDVLQAGPLTFERDARRALCAGNLLHLRPTESTLLEALMTRPRHVLERVSLKRIAWGGECSDRALESALSRVRTTVLDVGGPRIIIPVRGIGYRLGLD